MYRQTKANRIYFKNHLGRCWYCTTWTYHITGIASNAQPLSATVHEPDTFGYSLASSQPTNTTPTKSSTQNPNLRKISLPSAVELGVMGIYMTPACILSAHRVEQAQVPYSCSNGAFKVLSPLEGFQLALDRQVFTKYQQPWNEHAHE
jgi:hypothetical protein